MSAPTNDPLAGIRSKIKWAKKHVADLNSTIRDFLDARPYEVGANRDPNTRKPVYKVTNVKDVPCDISHLAGDTFSSLISILDHLAFRLYKKHSPTGDGRSVYFPISRKAKTTAEYVTSCEGKVQGIEPTVVVPDLLSVEAYQGGKGHNLWVLNELNNLSKHRELVTVGSQFRSMDIGGHLIRSMAKMLGGALPEISAFFRPADPLCPLKIGDELFIDLPDAEVDPQLKFAFEVAIHEPQITKPQPLIETVHQLAGVVESIVNRFAKYL